MIIQYTKNGKKLYKFRNIYIGKDFITGREIRKSKANFKTKKEAEIYIAKLRLDFENGNSLIGQNITFNELFNLWYDGYKTTIRESTLINSKSQHKHILKKFGTLQVKKISPTYCQKILNEWAMTYSTYKILKGKVVNILNFAIELKIISTNPMAIAKTPRKEKEIIDNKTLYYSKEELQEFLNLVEQEKDTCLLAMFRLLSFTGCRKSELQALEWADIDFTNKTININKTIAYNSNYELITQAPKTKTSIREISIDGKTTLLLKRWKIEQKEIMLKIGLKTNICFYNFNSNKYFRHSYLNNKLEYICNKHNFKKIKIHGFRHTHCSLLFESGATIQEVKERLGHSDINVTMNIYAHVTEKQKERVGTAFAKYVNF